MKAVGQERGGIVKGKVCTWTQGGGGLDKKWMILTIGKILLLGHTHRLTISAQQLEKPLAAFAYTKCAH